MARQITALGQKSAVIQLDMGVFGTNPHFVQQLKDLLSINWQTDHFDYLVNHAGSGATIAFEQLGEAAFDNLMNIHFKGVFFLTQQLVPLIMHRVE